MNTLIRSVLAASVSLLAIGHATAQQAILQGGPWVPGHAPQYVAPGTTNPVVQDGGGSGGGSLGKTLGELGVTSRSKTNTYPSANSGNGPNGEHACLYDGPTTNPTGFHYFCIDPNAQGGALISAGAGGGAAQLPLQFMVNGQLSPLVTPSMIPSSLGVTFNAIDPAASPYNADPTGNTDASAAINAALTACGAFGGMVYIQAPYKFLVTGTDLSVPSKCYLVGSLNGGYGAGQALASPPNDYRLAPHQIKLSPFRTIRYHRNSGGQGLSVIASNWAPATTLQGIASMVAGFAGTANTLGPEGSSNLDNGSDITLRDMFILGFNQCIDATWADRARGWDLFGDCTNGLKVSNSHDVSRFDNVHWWPFASQNQTPSTNVNTVAIVDVENDGGAFQITTNIPHQFVTGNNITLNDIAGFAPLLAPADLATNPNGTWPIQVIDATRFNLVGSTYTPSYTTGGYATLDNVYRLGKGYSFDHSEFVVCNSCFDFDHAIGAYFGDGAVWVQMIAPGMDGLLLPNFTNKTRSAFYVDEGADRTVVIGGFASSSAFPIYHGTSLRGTQTTDLSIGATNAWGPFVAKGALTIKGGDITGGYPSYVADAAVAYTMAAVQINSGSIVTYQNATTGCPKVTIDGLVGPCPWTPTLFGATTAGSPTYTARSGEYTIQSNGLVNVNFQVVTTSLGGLSGHAQIGGLPTPAGAGTVNACTISRLSGFTADANYTMAAGQISPLFQYIILSQLSNAGLGTIEISSSNLAAASEFAGACTYHK